MSEDRVALTTIIPSRRLAAVQVDADLAARFNEVSSAASDKFGEIGDAFYQAFLEEVGTDDKGTVKADRPLVDLLVRLSEPLHRLGSEHLQEPIFSPVIGRAESLEPPVGDPLRDAYFETFAWLVGVLGGRWKCEGDAVRPVDPQACVPHWFIYSLLEMGRKYVLHATDRAASPMRAKMYLFEDHVPDEWHLGRPRYQTEQVFLDRLLWIRRSTESREDFLLRILGDVVDAALNELVPAAESMDTYLAGIDLPYDGEAARTSLERARECARAILGKQVPGGGSGGDVRDRLLTQLGFLELPSSLDTPPPP